MSFGLKKALVAFQRVMDVKLALLKLEMAILYFDDVIAFLEEARRHIWKVKQDLKLTTDSGRTRTTEICAFFFNRSSWFGHVISPDKYNVACKTTDAITGLSSLTVVSDIRSFLEFRNVYHTLFCNFARLDRHGSQRLKKNETARLELHDLKKKAIDTLKERLPLSPVLALAQTIFKLISDTAACYYRVGCAQLQNVVDETLKTVGSWWKTSTPSKMHHDTTHEERLAVIRA